MPQLPFNITIEESDTIRESEIKKCLSINDKNIEWCDNTSQISTESAKLQTILKLSSINISVPKLLDDIKQIDKDIERTSFIIEMTNKMSQCDIDSLVKSLRNILITFVAFNQNINDSRKENCLDLGYTQGYVNIFK
jgi:hypothetical protein